jgi:hypothetical protein
MDHDAQNTKSPIMVALEKFEAAEANLVKLERLSNELDKLVPSGIAFGSDPEYEDRSRAYSLLLTALPKIDGWRPSAEPPELDDIARNRFDAEEVGEVSAHAAVHSWLEEPAKELREYRFRLNNKRRALIRDALTELIDLVDADIRILRKAASAHETNVQLDASLWADMKDHVNQIEVLLGSSVQKPPRWFDLRRHMNFGYVGDLNDIDRMDWPSVKTGLRQGLYGTNEPLPVGVDDLSELVAAKPRGPISTQLTWSNLNDEDFERLIFSLISDAGGYENPQWLMQTHAPDRGRDLSATRVSADELAGTFRQRIIIQCKHWQTRSVALPDVTIAKDQMALWSDPRVDVLVVATSGRFTADAVTWIEQHNAGSGLPRIEMWPDSHLERLLAARPALIAEFRLR